MSETPPEQPVGSRPTMGMPTIPSGARMPVPGNAEFALYALTAFYFLSRGIAKASRVLEQ